MAHARQARRPDRGGRAGLGGPGLGHPEGTLLSILPVLAVWQAGSALGWTGTLAGKLSVGALALAASLLGIAIHRLGYRQFRAAAIGYPLLGCAVFSLATC